MKFVNARITDAGLYYVGHYNSCHIRIELETRGGGASVTFSASRIPEFMKMFNNDLDLEDGVFVHDLKDVAVRLMKDEENRIVGIGDILAEEDEMFELDE